MRCFRKMSAKTGTFIPQVASWSSKNTYKEESLYINICIIEERIKIILYLCSIKITKKEDVNRFKVVLDLHIPNRYMRIET